MHTSAAVSGATLFEQNVAERDALRRITHLTEAVQGTLHDVTYAYDTIGRLTQQTRDGVTTTYGYDPNGNRTSTAGATPIVATYDAQDRILTYGTVTYKHDDHGDLSLRTDGAKSLATTYDELGNLMQATVTDGGTSKVVKYVVDGLGRRVGRQVNGTFDRAWLYRDSLRPIAEIDSAGTFTHFVYTSHSELSGAPDAMIRSGVLYRIVKDHLGSVRLVINAETGAVEQRIDYDAFGRVLSETGAGFQPFGFAGGLYDATTGLVRFGARDYDPETGRWTNKDPIGFGGQQGNVHLYVGGDPVNGVDPDGEHPIALAIAGGLGVLLATSDREAYIAAGGAVVGAVLGPALGLLGRAVRVGGWTNISRGLQTRRIGNFWVKRVHPQANSLMQAWGRHSLSTQARALDKLGDLAVSHSLRDGVLITEHVCGTPSVGMWARVWLEGSGRIGVLNDIRMGNMGANGLVFDPALDVVDKSLLIGGSVVGTSAVIHFFGDE